MADIQVAIGIIEHGDKVLMGRKVEGEHPMKLGGLWVFVGGTVEPGETLKQCLKREIMEEANISVEVERNLGSFSKKNIELNFFLCHPTSFDASPSSDLQELKWVPRKEVLTHLEQRLVEALPEEVVAYLSSFSISSSR